MEKINDYIEMRRNNNAFYVELLKDIEGITFQPERKGCKNIYWMNALVINADNFGINRDRLMDKLLGFGILTRKFFVPMHKQPALQKYGCDCDEEYPVANWLSDNGLYLPSGSGLKVEQKEFICEKIKEIRKSI
jgi:perosamine synthetase